MGCLLTFVYRGHTLINDTSKNKPPYLVNQNPKFNHTVEKF